MPKLSTGLRNKLLDSNSLDAVMAAGFVKIYTGAAPADADAAVTGTLLNTISIASSGTGVNFAASAVAGVLSKSSSEVWSGVGVASGTAGYFRHVAVGDDGALSTTQARIQGTMALAGGDMNVSNLTFASGTTRFIDNYSVAAPTL